MWHLLLRGIQLGSERALNKSKANALVVKETKMENEFGSVKGICRRCGCTEAQAAADARVLGFLDEFHAGIYTCCEVVQWADEQWLAWRQAGVEDGKPADEVTRPLEVEQSEAVFVHVRMRRPDDSGVEC
ncbi:MAG: hypothetical protein JOY54_19330 [Acidobacteriaceae bacterium]|nr:hypothetical protein [Acidobacteriaceae bacterium]